MATISLEGVYKWYQPGQPVVKDVNLHIEDKEFLVIVGPSGCGKSTTLRMIAGLEDISQGELRIDGRRMNEVPPKDRDIAMVFQNYALYPHMTVFQNMAFGLKLRKTPKAEIQSRVQEAARILGLEPYLDRKPKELSGGQRQRVAVGRAIVRQPKVFLFDEPLSNLDAKMRVQTRGEIARLHQNLQATMVYVTHDQVEAMTLGTRIVVMDGGQVQQVDTPLNLYNRPKNQFVAGFIGSPAMNFVKGRLKGGHQPQFEAEGGLVCQPHPSVFDHEVDASKQQVVFGIRSEHWIHGNEGDAGFSKFIVEVAEPLGSETYLFGKIGDAEICIRTHGRAVPEPGSIQWIRPDPEEVHLFSLIDGSRL